MSVCLLAGVVIYCGRAQRFFSKFIDIYRPCQQQNLLALSLGRTAEAAAAAASRRPLLPPLSLFLLAGL